MKKIFALFLLIALPCFGQTTVEVMDVLNWQFYQITGRDATDGEVSQSVAETHTWGWTLTNAVPTKLFIVANAATAHDWLVEHRKDEKADYETWRNVDKDSLIGLVKVLIDRDNRWTSWLMDFKAATSNATSLADFKVRVNALDNLPKMDRHSLTNAIRAKL